MAAVHGSGEQVILSSADMTATVVTWGGGIRELTCGDWAVLDGYGIDDVPVGAYGQPLIPWPNRLAGGTYEFRGVRYQVPWTEPEKGNALHGFARWMTWTVESAAADRAVLGLTLYPRSGYPFMLRVEIEYTLTPTGLRVGTTARNVGSHALPYANGFHPYVSLGPTRVDEWTLELPAGSWLPTDERQIPTGVEPVDGTPYDFRDARTIGSQRLDTAFTDLGRDADALASVRIRNAETARRVDIWMDAAYGFVMAYTGDTLSDTVRRRRALGVEPMTCAPNGFQTGDGLQVLEPGEEFASAWGIEIG